MYELGKRSTHRQRTTTVASLAVLIIVLLAGAWITKHYLKAETSLQQSTAMTHTVKLAGAEPESFEKPMFSIALPHGWKEVSPPSKAHKPYSWRGSDDADRMRSLDIYVDDIPTDMAVNHMLPIQSDNNKIDTLNAVSDNCAGFTGASDKSDQTGTGPAKWSGVKFICDMGNKTRNVTGTSSPKDINSVAITGHNGTHRYFFVYTDNSSSPDYSIFTSALTSFSAK